MRFTRLLTTNLLILSSLSSEAFARETRVNVRADGSIDQVIWLTPTGDRKVLFPGYINYCSPPTTSLIVATAYAATQLSDKSQWTQKLTFGVDPTTVTSENARLTEIAIFKVTCEVQVSEKKAMDITLSFKIDWRQRYENIDGYTLALGDDRVVTSLSETPVTKGARLVFGRRYSFGKPEGEAAPVPAQEEPKRGLPLKNSRPYSFGKPEESSK